jgi:Leucine-rich repeat (LRR) protein
MKTVTLLNPEAAQKVFQSRSWSNTWEFYIKVLNDNSESVLVNAEVATQKGEGNSLKIRVGTTYEISLTEFDDTVSIEFEDIQGLGALLRLNDSPYMLRVFGSAIKEQISTIGSVYPELRIIDFGSAENETIRNLHGISECAELKTLNLDNCPNLDDLSILPLFSKLDTLYLVGFSELIDLSPLNQIISLSKLRLGASWKSHTLSCSLIDVGIFSDLTKLTSLELTLCIKLVDISPLSKLKNLTNLKLDYCSSIADIAPLSCLTKLETLLLRGCELISDFKPISELTNLTYLNLSGCMLSEITSLSKLTNLTKLNLAMCASINNIDVIGNLTNLTKLNLAMCESIQDINPLAKLNKLKSLDMRRCKNLTLINLLVKDGSAIIEYLELEDSPNIRDFALLGKLKHLKELTWIDPVACSEVLMQSALNREDAPFIEKNIKQWNSELLLCKDANHYATLVLSCVNLITFWSPKEVAQNMRARGLQSEAQNDLEPFIWEKWCAMVTELPYREASDCLSFVTNELNLEQETFVLLGPVLLACAELLDNNPEKEKEITAWVGEQLALLAEFPHLERQIAPSAAVYYASIQKQSKVEQWLIKATDEKMPLWRERVLTKLVGYYGAKQQFSQAKNLLAQMNIQEEKDEALAALSLSMASEYPVDAAFLLDEIHQNSIVVQTAKTLLHSESVLAHPQGIYQLFLHLQNTPEELEHCLSSLVEQDKSGKVAEAIQKLFVTPADTNGTSTAAFLLLCEHPGLNDFVKPRALQKYKDNLLGKSKNEAIESTDAFVLDLLEQGLIEMEEVNEITLALKN